MFTQKNELCTADIFIIVHIFMMKITVVIPYIELQYVAHHALYLSEVDDKTWTSNYFQLKFPRLEGSPSLVAPQIGWYSFLILWDMALTWLLLEKGNSDFLLILPP